MHRVVISYRGTAPLDLLAAAGFSPDRHLPRHEVIYGTCRLSDVPLLELIAGVTVVAAVR